jgi:hypothetical protein
MNQLSERYLEILPWGRRSVQDGCASMGRTTCFADSNHHKDTWKVNVRPLVGPPWIR